MSNSLKKRHGLTISAVPEGLWTSSGQGLRVAMAMMYAPKPVPITVRNAIRPRDLIHNQDQTDRQTEKGNGKLFTPGIG